MDGRRVVLVAALVALAGCSGFVGGGTDEATPTPTSDVTAVPVTDTPTPAAERSATRTPPSSLPPGVSANGTVDTGLLAWTHDRALANRSYTWSFKLIREATDAAADGDETRLELTRDADAFLVDQPAPDGTDDRALYVANGTGYLAYLAGDETTVLRTDDPGDVDRYDYSTRLIIRYMTGPTFDVRTVERDGRVFYRLYAQSGPLPRVAETFDAPVSNFSATAYVTPDGFVRTLAVRYDRPEAASRERVRIRFDYTAVGETAVTEPDWLDEATPVTATPAPTATDSATPPASTANATDSPVNATDSPSNGTEMATGTGGG